MTAITRSGIRRIVLFLAILGSMPLPGCGEPQPDLGGAVVVPEPGTTASGDAGEGDQ
jgi:hypothetical protein